ncbi:MAG: hypothetical protein GC172_02025 [Phycisphaera sp.]|nr:hypothetical protein [Phycisphaera sp.]
MPPVGLQPPPAPNNTQRLWVYLARAKAAFALVTVLLTVVASFALAPLLRQIAEEQSVQTSGLAGIYLERPWIGALLGVPALLASIPLWTGARRPLLWATLVTILVIIPIGFLLGAFLGVIAPLYEYREL